MPLLCIAGLPGSGKSTVSRIIEEYGVKVFVMGDYVRRFAEQNGIPVDKAASMIRILYGTRAVAKMVLSDLAKFRGNAAVEGLRSREEYEAFKEAYPDAKLLFIVASLGERFRRLSSRGRPDDPKDLNDLLIRDYRESTFGLTDLVSLADYIIVNENVALSQLKELIAPIIREVYGINPQGQTQR